MSGSRSRRALITAGVTLAIGLVAMRLGVVYKAETSLAKRGFQWESRGERLLGVQWQGVRSNGLTADEVDFTVFPPSLHARRIAVDLEAIAAERRPRAGPQGNPEGTTRLVDTSAEDVTVTWGDTVLIEGLGGSLYPLDLENADGWITSGDAGLEGRLPVRFQGDVVAASGIATFNTDQGAIVARLDLDRVRVAHETLSATPLDGPAQVTVEWEPTRRSISAFGNVWGIPFDATAIEPTAEDTPILGRLGPVGLDVLLEAFEAPERHRAKTQGTLEATFELSFPSLEWSVVPKVESISATGVLPDPDAIRVGPVSWKVRDSNGERILRRPPGWVDLDEAGWVDDAIIAIEDSRFHEHPGYDLANIREALDEWSHGETRPRGGSTLTQQLAKNLYLDGDRTLERKLRELVYALALERTARKDRLLAVYLNVVEFAPGVYGIGPASAHYFAKKPALLSPNEAALLAALLPAPQSTHARIAAGRLPMVRVGAVLDSMVFTGALSKEEAAAWKEAPLRVALAR